MSDTESTQLWNDEDDDLQDGQAFSDALASLGDHLHEQQGIEDETQADAEMYDEGVNYETSISQTGNPAEVSYADLTEDDAFIQDQSGQTAGLSLDDELDNLIPDEPVASSFQDDTDFDAELNSLRDSQSESGDIDLPLDDELDASFGTPMHVENAPTEMSFGAELDAVLNDDAAAEEAFAGEDGAETDDQHVYSDDSQDVAGYAEESDEAPAAEDDGYFAQEDPAAEELDAYPSYEEPEAMDPYETETAATMVEDAPEPADEPMMPMGGHEGTDDFNLATLTQLVDEIRQESDRVAEMKESVARALALIQEMSESLKS